MRKNRIGGNQRRTKEFEEPLDVNLNNGELGYIRVFPKSTKLISRKDRGYWIKQNSI